MKLWIRSQDRNKFSQVKICSYDYEENRHIVNCNGYPYGVYQSKERCLEIIDEIQGRFGDFMLACNIEGIREVDIKKLGLRAIDYYIPHEKPKIEYHNSSTIVYEMPKE